jgi:hypothetical protein
MKPLTFDEMNRAAVALKTELPPGYGFVFFAFPLGKPGHLQYGSNAQRADVVDVLQAFLGKGPNLPNESRN